AAAVLADAFLDGLEQQLRSHLAASAQPLEGAPDEVSDETALSAEASGGGLRHIGEAEVPGGSAPAGELVPAAPAAEAAEGHSEPSADQAVEDVQAEPAAPAATAQPERWTWPQLSPSPPPARPAPIGAAAAAPSGGAAPVTPPSDADIRTQGSAMLNTIARPQGDRPSLQFQGANAKQGQPYRGTLTAKPDRPHVVTQVTGPAGVDLEVDPETREIVGLFAEAGDIKLDVEYRFEDEPTNVVRSSTMTLVVNPDPRLMWKDIPSNESEPFWKPDRDCARHEAEGARLIAASQRGRSHAHKGTCRDDDFFIGTSNGWRIGIVADGAGSAKFSRRGAQLAVSEAGKFLTDKLTKDSELLATAQAVADGNAEAKEKLRRELYSFVGHAAHMALKALENETEAAATPAIELRDLNTTLLIAVSRPMGDHTVVGTWTVGDGAVGILSGGGCVDLGGVPDGGEFSGGTRFLAHAYVEPQELLNRTRAFALEGVEAIVLMTDGVSDPMFKNDRALESREAWDGLLSKIGDEAQFDIRTPELEEGVEERVLDWLNFWVTGEHDDRTLAFIW
ncbi:MAG TPA: PP2C family serine/threonine-protein phosphatase, partial [Rariglobus sp.]